MVPFPRVRVLVDYRPALRARTGIGEYVHELARALAWSHGAGVQVTAFAASWADRIGADARADLPGVHLVERPIPVGALRWSWHRLSWPPVEWLAGVHDVAHSPTPLLLPARRAAQLVTVFDLHFLHAPDEARDVAQQHFAARVRDHVTRADHVIAGSAYAASLLTRELGVGADRISTTPLGAPRWAGEVLRRRSDSAGDILLFLGTLEPRKNVGLLLDGYERLLRRRPDAPPLVLAGGLARGGETWVERAGRPPLAGHVRIAGYVSEAERRALYAGARALLLPSREEGFGLTALEAMACGVPVVASPAGPLPDLVGDAGTIAPLDAPDAWADAIEACLDDTRVRAWGINGVARALAFTWSATATATIGAYRAALAARAERR